MSEAKAGHIHSYNVQCNACRAGFERTAGEDLVAIDKDTWARTHANLWMVPPWVDQTLEAEFLFSWDVVVEFFSDLERRGHAVGGPMRRLVMMFRVAGYDRTLSAGQSHSSLILSRTRFGGFPFKHSFLRLDIDAHGHLIVSGTIGGAPVLATHPRPSLVAVKSDVDRLVTVSVE